MRVSIGSAPSLCSLVLAAMTSTSLAAATSSFVDVVDGKLQAISSAGIAEATLDFPGDASRTLGISSTSSLKLSFGTKAIALSDGSSETPSIAYSSLIFSASSPRSLGVTLALPTNASESGLFRRANNQVGSVSVALTPRKGGKYRWEWDLATTRREDILSLARRGQGRVRASLLLVPSTVATTTPEPIQLGFINFQDEVYWSTEKEVKWPREWEMDRYSPREELHWTFRSAQGEVNFIKIAFGLALVLAPWTILAGLLPLVFPTLNIVPHSSNIPFFVSLATLDAWILSYWFSLINAWQLMPLVAITSIIAFFTGKNALGYKMQKRLRSESDRTVGVEAKKSS